MNTIIGPARMVKLHGTCGSGKTTIARQFFKAARNVRPIKSVHNSKRIEAYCLDMGWEKPLWVLGSYESVCGGLDTCDADTCVDLVSRYGSKGDNVFYESMIASGFYGRMGKVSEQWGPHHIFAFLTTPIEVCIERTEQRRRDRGDLRPLDPVNVIDKDLAMQRLIERLQGPLNRVVKMVSTFEDVYGLYQPRND
jgi:hypothetical protein